MINGAKVSFREGDRVLYLSYHKNIPEWMNAIVKKIHLSQFNKSVIQIDLEIRKEIHIKKKNPLIRINSFTNSVMYPFVGVATYT